LSKAFDELPPRQRSTSKDDSALLPRRASQSSIISQSPHVSLSKSIKRSTSNTTTGNNNNITNEEQRYRSGSYSSLIANVLSSSHPASPIMGGRSNRIPDSEVIHVNPLEEKEVIVYYCPKASSALMPSLTLDEPIDEMKNEKWKKMFKHSFRLQFIIRPLRNNTTATTTTNNAMLHDAQIKTVWAECRTCLSLVSVSPTNIRFGDCLLNQKKTAILSFSNHSDIEAEVMLEVDSKGKHVKPSTTK
jgi:hypothetical protein